MKLHRRSIFTLIVGAICGPIAATASKTLVQMQDADAVLSFPASSQIELGVLSTKSAWIESGIGYLRIVNCYAEPLS